MARQDKAQEYMEIINQNVSQSDIDFPKAVFARILLGQLFVESSFRTDAVSPAGARGIAQFMPATWNEWGQGGNPFDVKDSIAAQVRFMTFLYSRFGEIPNPLERMKFALASYNAGRGNINRMLRIARESDGVPGEYRRWLNAGRPTGKWQQWWYASEQLPNITGHHATETRNYIDRIMGYVISQITYGEV